MRNENGEIVIFVRPERGERWLPLLGFPCGEDFNAALSVPPRRVAA